MIAKEYNTETEVRVFVKFKMTKVKLTHNSIMINEKYL